MVRFAGVELDDLELRGARLDLRPWRPDDADVVYEALREDALAPAFTSLPAPYTRQDAVQFVTEFGNAGRGDGTELGGALVERSTRQVVGSAALRLAGGAVEVGYLVYAPHRGHGYAGEATAMLTEWAFARGLPRVGLHCAVANIASARTALGAGFRFEGVSRSRTLRPADERGPARIADVAGFARLPGDPSARVRYAFPPLDEELGDGVLRLRGMHGADASVLAETDDELTLRWGFTGVRHTAAETRRAAEGAALEWLVGQVVTFSMVDIADGRVAGFLRLRLAGPPQVGGIGYVVHPAFRGRGYTTRALRLLVPWAFEVADFARLELGAKVGNEASLRAAAAAGFEPDGVRRCRLRNPDGSFSDEFRYTLLNPRYS